ncbi:MAG: glycosyltransferase [Candidatus Methylumidiphilus sp.]
MNTFLLVISVFASLVWFIVLILPWRPWLNGETLEPIRDAEDDLSEITVLIPARNEAEVIAATLQGLAGQGHSGLKVVLVDDGSDDGTASLAKHVKGVDLTIINSQILPDGWSGKLWALEQGIRQVKTTWTLLLDADILLAPGMIAALLGKAKGDNRQFVSIMASLRMVSFWERLLMPAFIYFFKLLYPFRLANSDSPYVAAAAGGCILLETRLIAQIGGFSAIRGEIIDDCNLAKQVKRRGNRIWIGQSHSVISLRNYDTLKPIWDMVARSAFAQLNYSVHWLALCTGMVTALFLVPVAGIVWGEGPAALWSAVAYFAMMGCFLPTLNYYRKNPAWALSLPAIASLYLAMTWNSAFSYWRGVRSQWKNRIYSVDK